VESGRIIRRWMENPGAAIEQGLLNSRGNKESTFLVTYGHSTWNKSALKTHCSRSISVGGSVGIAHSFLPADASCWAQAPRLIALGGSITGVLFATAYLFFVSPTDVFQNLFRPSKLIALLSSFHDYSLQLMLFEIVTIDLTASPPDVNYLSGPTRTTELYRRRASTLSGHAYYMVHWRIKSD
ncbi:hypothetical protein HN51_003984, partial [Arachis hypogaea]